MIIEKLPEGISMQLFLRNNDSGNLPWIMVYYNSKKWLHPLFELEEFLSTHAKEGCKDCRIFEFEGGLKVVSSDLLLRDRIVGRAAAFLILRMGICRIEADIVSQGALSLLKENSIAIETKETIDAIQCITEDLLKDNLDAEDVYRILTERRAKESQKYLTQLG